MRNVPSFCITLGPAFLLHFPILSTGGENISNSYTSNGSNRLELEFEQGVLIMGLGGVKKVGKCVRKRCGGRGTGFGLRVLFKILT